MGGCDGRMKETTTTPSLPRHCRRRCHLTAGCAKYKFNKLNLGIISSIPRVLDTGQVQRLDIPPRRGLPVKLQEVFGLDDINKLPIIYNASHGYETESGHRVAGSAQPRRERTSTSAPRSRAPLRRRGKVLVDNFGIAGIGTVEDDSQPFDRNKWEHGYTRNMNLKEWPWTRCSTMRTKISSSRNRDSKVPDLTEFLNSVERLPIHSPLKCADLFEASL